MRTTRCERKFWRGTWTRFFYPAYDRGAGWDRPTRIEELLVLKTIALLALLLGSLLAPPAWGQEEEDSADAKMPPRAHTASDGD